MLFCVFVSKHYVKNKCLQKVRECMSMFSSKFVDVERKFSRDVDTKPQFNTEFAINNSFFDLLLFLICQQEDIPSLVIIKLTIEFNHS